MDNTETLET